MVQGITGKILRVNLTDRKVSIEEPDELFYRRYLGGAGFVGYYLLKEMKPGTDPLSPDNLLIFALGPVTGAAVPGGARNCIGAKSPLTGGMAKSEVGGFFGYELKRAGYDSLIVEGRAESPVYLWLNNGEVEIRDASSLWGMTVLETQDAIEAELGERMVRTATIGPAGENMAAISCIMTDLRNAAGRGGLGAVMGSKNLKCVAVKGRKGPQAADAVKLREMAQWMNKNYMNVGAASHHSLGTGTAASMVGGNSIGNLPVRNWGDGLFEEVEKITADTLRDTVRVAMEACPACQIRCKKVVELETETYKVDRRNGGPEYESLAAFGSYLGIDDLNAICRANELCGLYSLDTISTGCTIGFAMECYEKEILTPKDTGGIDLRFGNVEAMLQVIDLIAKREGIGDILADGSLKAAQRIGGGAEEYAMQVKGLEFGMHEPRLKQGLGLAYAVSAFGADHVAGIHDTGYTREGPEMDSVRQLGVPEPLPANDLSAAKAFMVKSQHMWRLFGDSLTICRFVPWTINQQVELLRALTGWDYTAVEALQLGERVATMARVFNVREGFTSADDTLPKRFFSPTPRGALKDTAIDPEELERAVHTFYGLMDWDPETGVPTEEKLQMLGIGWAAD
ncbi:MAG TPA: aldehyde ferredoxin oxidoreductase family protein [Dehalococcoidia bacterium]|jgi:aldehyde:ferredoxin oxidoreductase|nr:aldehyde ferredoxin oxidoreductase family protein [Dehalococcoidia bacterium]